MIREISPDSDQAPPQVFVSYAHADAEQVIAIARLLEQEGVVVWRDSDRILGGQSWGEEIVHAVAHSRVVMLMCSPHSLQSEHVCREVWLAWDYHRRYIPVWLTPVMEIPDGFRLCLVNRHWIDAYSQPQERWLPQLLKSLQVVGVETTHGRSQPSDATPSPAGASADTDRGGLRFKAGDRPIRGADWELELLLGKGGFGEVWKAHNPDLPSQPPVALKFCLQLDDRSRDLLRHEAEMVLRAQQQIRSSGVVPLVHAYLNNDPPCLEYPYVAGGTLVQLIDECHQSTGLLKPAQAQQIVERVAQIVSAAHRATPKLVHRDLKPANILVERREARKIVLRVTDFGIGGLAAEQVLERSRSSSLQENMASVLTGSYSPLYASPQQIRGERPDPRDDVYALGVIWYQLLTGDLTSPAPTGRRWIDGLRRQGMSDAAVELLSSCFESDPAHRPDDAGMLADLLRKLPRSASTTPANAASELPLAELARWVGLKKSSPPPTIKTEPVITPVQTQSTTPGTDTKPASPAAHALWQGAPWASALRERFLGWFRGYRERFFGWFSGYRRWVGVGLVGLAGLLGVILNMPAPEYLTTKVGQIKLKRIPAGKFEMGSADNDGEALGHERPQHPVRISEPFYLGVYEINQAQYRAVMGTNHSHFPVDRAGKDKIAGESRDRHPAENVSWFDAVKFCNTLSEMEGRKPFYEINGKTVRVLDWNGPGYRLPTEAEWEYACRANAPTPQRYSFGDTAGSVDEFAWYSGNSEAATHPVGDKLPNAFGLFDMHGNVWEWCWDCYTAVYYREMTRDDPRGPARAPLRVGRGGCWNYAPHFCRSASRLGLDPASPSLIVGFRLALGRSGR
ncbi:MAG: SUMF1/EgtB/PvdO family nonheme iron enzyme [Isosphaeraceae bacterium]